MTAQRNRGVVFARATLLHAAELAGTARPDDVLEVEAATGMGIDQVLIHGVLHSAESYTALIDGKVLAIYGVQPLVDGHGWGWLVTSELVEQHRLAFWQGCKRGLTHLLNKWRTLANYIDARHTRALLWARRLGFRIAPAEPQGPSGVLAHPVLIRLEDLRCALPR